LALTVAELRMPNAGLARIAGRAKLAPGELIVNVRSSTFETVMVPRMFAALPPRPLARLSVKMTSSEVIGVPSANSRSGRRRIVSHLPSGERVYSASPGTTFVGSAGSRVVRVSYSAFESIAPLRLSMRLGSSDVWSKTVSTTRGRGAGVVAVLTPAAVSEPAGAGPSGVVQPATSASTPKAATTRGRATRRRMEDPSSGGRQESPPLPRLTPNRGEVYPAPLAVLPAWLTDGPRTR
jgi:hypothetical protein